MVKFVQFVRNNYGSEEILANSGTELAKRLNMWIDVIDTLSAFGRSIFHTNANSSHSSEAGSTTSH